MKERQDGAKTRKAHPLAAVAGALADASAPAVFSAIAFVAGALTLAAAAAPDIFQNRLMLRMVAPLPVIELSHFFASIIGVLLLLVAAGLKQRLDSAWIVAVILLGAGALFSLLSGGHYWRAIGLAVVMILLAASRAAFYRRSALREMKLPPLWIGAIVAVLAGIAWLGLFSFDHVEYRDDLWWTFARDAEASRFLRGEVTAIVALLMFIAWRLLSIRSKPPGETRGAETDARIDRILAEGDSVRPDACLAYLRDKRFLFSETGSSFIMYGVQGRNWIAMGPPVGLAGESRELAWAFKALADRYHGNAVFYSFSDDFLPTALDLGLSAQKIGESAVVPLEDFSLEGGARSKLRQTRRTLAKEGASFAVLPSEEVRKRIDELKTVSDQWLARHKGEEKRFTLGRFDADYIGRFPAAAMLLDGRIVAFANLWATSRSRELSVDLMRYGEAAPHGVMEGLFIELMLWGKENGYRSLDLGMAPLSGLDRRRLAPAISRFGALVYELGEGVYGFEGLRKFKEKFRPDWKPLYLAAPNRVDVAFALGGVALLTSGGLRGIMGRKS